MSEQLKLDSLIIDVRDPDEFNDESIEGSINIPLAEMQRQGIPLIKKLGTRHVTLICQSGQRSQSALRLLEAAGIAGQADSYQGGINCWKNCGHPTVSQRQSTISIFRQVMIVAGSLVTLGSLAAVYLEMSFIVVPLFVGFGLLMAGLTGFCPMGIVLSRAPWNRGSAVKIEMSS